LSFFGLFGCFVVFSVEVDKWRLVEVFFRTLCVVSEGDGLLRSIVGDYAML